MPSTDSGSTGGGTTPTTPVTGGGGGGCIWIQSYLPGGELAQNLAQGDELLLLNDNDLGYHQGPVERLRYATQMCYRITTLSGITLVCSDTTPITTRNGATVSLVKSLGVEVPVLDVDDFRWEPIVGMEALGYLPVVLVSADNGTYAAGENNDNRFIFTHNSQVKQ